MSDRIAATLAEVGDDMPHQSTAQVAKPRSRRSSVLLAASLAAITEQAVAVQDRVGALLATVPRWGM